MSNSVRFEAKNGLNNNGNTITGVATPSNTTDAANKGYVDALGLAVVASVSGTQNQVIASASTGNITLSLPQSIATTSAPTFVGTNFNSIPNGALQNFSITLGSTNVALGGSASTLAGLSSVTSTWFTGTLNGNASTATNIVGGGVNQIPFQYTIGETGFISAPTTPSTSLQWNGGGFQWGPAGTVTSVSVESFGPSSGAITIDNLPITSSGTISITPNLFSTSLPTPGVVPGANLAGSGYYLDATGAWSVPQPTGVTSLNGSTNISVSGSTGLVTVSLKSTLSGLTSVTSTTFVGSLTGSASLNLPLTGGTMSGAITGLPSPINSTDAVNKAYVDASITGLTWKNTVATATTANITLSGEQTIDGILTSASRVLVKNQTTASANGIYISGTSAWTRSTDATTGTEILGSAVYVDNGGTVNSGTAWTNTNVSAITVGTTSITFAQFGGGQTYTAGTGLTLGGNVFSLTNSSTTINGTAIALGASGTVTAAAGTLTGTVLNSTVVSSSLTSVGTLGSLAVSGTTTSNLVSINGIGLVGSATLTTSATTANQVVDTKAIATYRAVKYLISVTSGTAYHYTEVQLLQDGTNTYVSEINTMLSGVSLASFDGSISAGNLQLLVTPVNAVTTIKAVVIAIVI